MGGSIFYSFDPETGIANPGPGKLRLNNVNPSEATALYINETDGDSANVKPWLDTGIESTGTPPSYLMIRSASNPHTYHVFEVNGLLFDVGEYSLYNITHVAGQGAFIEGEQLALQLNRTGNDGTNAELPYTDYGLVSTLPESPSVGDRCIFKANESTFWQLVYDGQGSYPWKKIGGPPLRSFETTSQTISSKTFQTTGAPSITAPLAMQFNPNYGAVRIQNQSGEFWGASVGLFINGSLTVEDEVVGRATYDATPAQYIVPPQTIAKGQTVQTRYRSTQGTLVSFIRLFVEIDPIRVG